jgi:hypothetical protein
MKFLKVAKEKLKLKMKKRKMNRNPKLEVLLVKAQM